MEGDLVVLVVGVEDLGEAAELYKNPKHPYTVALLSAVPKPNPVKEGEGRIVLGGEVPSPSNPPSGCPFHPRCPLYAERKDARCVNEMPPLEGKGGDGGHRAACWLT